MTSPQGVDFSEQTTPPSVVDNEMNLGYEEYAILPNKVIMINM